MLKVLQTMSAHGSLKLRIRDGQTQVNYPGQYRPSCFALF